MPGPSAEVVARLTDGSGNASIYGYEAGALLIDGTTPAPARRVNIFVTGDAYTALTAEGRQLVNAAINWALEGQPPGGGPEFTSFGITSEGVLTIEWSGGGVLENAPSVLGPWTPVNGASSPFSAPTDRAAQIFRLRQ